MGYRTLLKRYIQHVELAVGDNFIETGVPESELTVRDVGELRTIAAELRRVERALRAESTRNPNQRLRLLMSRYALDNAELAAISGVSEAQIRQWRASPSAASYLALQEQELDALERSVQTWLESARRPADTPPSSRKTERGAVPPSGRSD